MKKVVLAVLVLGCSVSSAAAQSKEEPAPAGTTRVAIVNIGHIYDKYEKAIAFKAELEELLKPFKAKAKVLTDEMKAWHDQLQTPNVDAERKEKLESGIRSHKRLLEDMQLEVQKLIGKRQEDNQVVLWNEIREGVKTYGVKHDIHLVLAFNNRHTEPAKGEFNPYSVNRKRQWMDYGGSTTVSLFAGAGAEITEPITDILNRQYRESPDKKSTKPGAQGKGTPPTGTTRVAMVNYSRFPTVYGGSRVAQASAKRQEDDFVAQWKDIQRAVRTYARDHGIDLVLAYRDPLEETKLNSFSNINRKLQAMDGGGMVPLLVRPGVDITEGVMSVLSRQPSESK